VSTHTKSWLSHRLGTMGRWWQFPGSVVAVVTFGGSNSMKEAFVRLASHSAVLRTLQRFRNESLKKKVIFSSSSSQTCRPLLLVGQDGN